MLLEFPDDLRAFLSSAPDSELLLQDPLGFLVFRKLAALAAQRAECPTWYPLLTEAMRAFEPFRTKDGGMGPGVGGERPDARVRLFRAVRDSGIIPSDAGLFIVAREIARITDDEIACQREQIEFEIDSLYASRGLSDWRWHPDRGADKFFDYENDRPHAWGKYFMRQLRRHGEREIGRLYLSNREQYEQRYDNGQDFFVPDWGRSPQSIYSARSPKLPALVRRFRDALGRCRCFEGITPGAPVFMEFRHFKHDGRDWIGVAPAYSEVKGGPRDGERRFRCFLINLEQLRTVFDFVEWSGWTPDRSESPQCTELAVEGQFAGVPVFVYFMAVPFEDDFGEMTRIIRP